MISEISHPQLLALKAELARYIDLAEVLGLLQWDNEVMMPAKSLARRSKIVSRLSGDVHEAITSQTIQDLLKAAEALVDTPGIDWNITELAFLRNLRRTVDISNKLPKEFVERFSEQRIRSVASWQQAKLENNFPLFAPDLERIVDLNREYAELKGYTEHPYNALLDDYQIGLDKRQVEAMFAELVPAIKLIMQNLKPQGPKLELVNGAYNYNPEALLAIGRTVMRQFGLDPKASRLDQSAHPFSQTLNAFDNRITTRTNPADFSFSLTATYHETGHALYGAGVDPVLEGSLLDSLDAMLGVHESQSRMWENLVGRSMEVCEFIYPLMATAFPWLSSYTPEDIFNVLNYAHPSLIRTESDELTYNLHVALRFDVELQLIEKRLAVKDLPEYWRGKMQDYLGTVPATDSEGVLQDIHWAHGTIGYFPTYTLGNIYGAQIFNSFSRATGDYKTAFRLGDFSQLLTWLRDNIHRFGLIHLPEDLIFNATGEKPTAKYLIQHLHSKFSS